MESSPVLGSIENGTFGFCKLYVIAELSPVSLSIAVNVEMTVPNCMSSSTLIMMSLPGRKKGSLSLMSATIMVRVVLATRGGVPLSDALITNSYLSLTSLSS